MNLKLMIGTSIVLIMLLLSGCSFSPNISYQPSGRNLERSMSFKEAKSILEQLSHSCSRDFDCGSFPPNMTGWTSETSITSVDIHAGKLILNIKDHVVYQTFPLGKLQVGAGYFAGEHAIPVLILNGWQMEVPGDTANRYADAITVIKGEAFNPEKEAAFAKIAETYRDATVKPIPGEDVRKYMVMANEAISRERFDDAVTDYEQGLKIAPWWPQGHFNVAMVLGQVGRYHQAIEHMKDYLALVPNAPNARAAQDQIYKWEGDEQAN